MFGRGGLDADQAHHSAVLVFEKMAVIDKCSHRVRIAKVHAEFDAGILRASSIPIGHVDCVAKKRLIDWHTVPTDQHEMDLMDVEGV